MNSQILQNGLKLIIENIQKIKKIEDKPTISCDNGSTEVCAITSLGLKFILCRFHILKDWKQMIYKIKKNKIKEIITFIEKADYIKEKNPNFDDYQFLNEYFNEIQIYENKKYDLNFDYLKNSYKDKKKNKK